MVGNPYTDPFSWGVETDIRLSVIKNSGDRVRYDRQKIFNGVERACYKLDINDDKLAELVDRVEEELLTNHDRKVTTEQIGIYVGAYLSRLSAVAYVRFMSVYRKFRTVEEFIEEVGHVRVRVARESPDQQSLFGR